MGSAMAKNLHNYTSKLEGCALHIYNRTASRGTSLVGLGAVQHDSVSSLVDHCDLIFLSISDDAALLSTVRQIIACSDLKGKFVVDTTTVHPNTTKEVAASLAEKDALFLAGKFQHIDSVPDHDPKLTEYLYSASLWRDTGRSCRQAVDGGLRSSVSC